MKKSVRIGLTVLFATPVVLIAAFFIFVYLTWYVFDESTVRSDAPLSYAEAAKKGGAYPPGASHIYYLTYAAGLQIGSFYQRMDVPPGQLDSAVDFLIAEHNHHCRSNEFSRSPDPRLDMDPRFEPAPWWDTMWITRGYRMSSSTATLVILVDEEHSRIYAHWTH